MEEEINITVNVNRRDGDNWFTNTVFSIDLGTRSIDEVVEVVKKALKGMILPPGGKGK